MSSLFGYVERMEPSHLKRPAFILAVGGSVLLAAIGVFSVTEQSRAQSALTLPAACTCSKAVPLANAAEIVNCRCETLQCVAIVTPGPTQSPALACVK